MKHHRPGNHFAGKSVVEHLKEARTRGMLASAEIHGTEMSGHAGAFADAMRDTSVALLFLWMILGGILSPASFLSVLILFCIGWLIWKTARSALLGWARLERLHRLIEEERWEIQHHRSQEKEELKALYAAKGFEGELLDQVVDVMMADDNRLLQIMLEEELGLTLEAFEHPLKQSVGACLGVFVASFVCLLAFAFHPSYGLPSLSCLLVFLGSAYMAKLERNHLLHAIVWNAAVLVLGAGAIFFFKQILR